MQADMTSCSGNEEPWKIGETRHINGKVVLCYNGYHSSPTWYDVLRYANGPIACIVDVPKKGTIFDSNKSASPSRTLVDARNANRVLRLWACDCAERALKMSKIENADSWNAVKTARLYAKGKATSRELAAARNAAWDAEWAAAWNAEGAAAKAAAWDAARAAAWDAARDDGEIKWQKRRLNFCMKKLFKEENNIN